MNEKRLKEQTLKLQALQRSVKLIGSMKDRKQLEYKEAMGLLEVISDYNYALGLLDDYDYKRLKVSHTSKEEKFILIQEAALEVVEKLKERFGGSDLFAINHLKAQFIRHSVEATCIQALRRKRLIFFTLLSRTIRLLMVISGSLPQYSYGF